MDEEVKKISRVRNKLLELTQLLDDYKAELRRSILNIDDLEAAPNDMDSIDEQIKMMNDAFEKHCYVCARCQAKFLKFLKHCPKCGSNQVKRVR